MTEQALETRYQLLLRKLEEFSRRYYKNQLIRGSIFFAALFLISLLTVAVLEHFGHFTIAVRTFLFYIFLILNMSTLAIWIIMPVLQLLRLREGLDKYSAAKIIGSHFPEISDKLYNTLQLKEAAEQQYEGASKALINASIDQRIEHLKPIAFSSAINFRENIPYLKYASVPLLILLVVFIANPGMIVDSTGRIIEHRSQFERPAPFDFVLQNDSLKAVRNQEFPIHLKIEGDQVPSRVFIELDGQRHRMQAEDNRNFTYRVRNPQRNMDFRFYADGFYSKMRSLNVYPRPTLEKFTVFLDYPEYTGKQPEEKDNIGDFSVPEGTEVTWIFQTRDVDSLLLSFADTSMRIPPDKGRTFVFSRTLHEDMEYAIRTSNEYFTSEDTLVYYADVIPDEYPEIQAEKQVDSLNPMQMYFRGEISDDYGFSSLTFNYRFLDAEQGTRGELQTYPVDISADERVQPFYYHWNLNQLNIDQGDQIEFFFEVRDNDAVNGPKTTRSQTFYYRSPTRREIAEEGERTRQEMQSNMDESLRELQQLRQEVREMEQHLMGKNDMNWQDERKIEDMIERHKQMQQRIEEMSRQFEESRQRQEQMGQTDDEMRERQQRMQELLDELMDDEKRELLQELQDALDEQQQDRVREKLRELESQDRFSEREMDRIRELFRELDFEQKLRDNIDQLEEMAAEQDELSRDSGDEGQSEEELTEKQEQLQEDFERFKEEMEGLEELNEQLRNPKNLDDFSDQMDDIDQNIQESIDQLMEQDRDGAREQQEQSRDKMQDMADQMKQMQMEMDMEAAMVNYESLRRILQNLVHFSFNQEDLLEAFGEVREHNPRFVELGQEQSRLSRYSGLIEDSLHALSMRLMQIGPIVSQEMNEINYHLEQAIDNISDRRMGSIRRHQQEVMTSANNLAVMLSEIMDNLQQQMAAQMEGQQMSQQQQMGDDGEPSMSRMQELQEELNQRMEEMMEDGEQPGGEGSEGDRGEQMDEEFARIAAEQERLRQMLREMRERREEETGESGSELQDIEEEMEETERDLLHRELDQETLERQQRIQVRMLEYEESERKQDREDEREAESPQEYETIRPEELEEFFRKRDSNIERLQTTPPRLNPYYRDKVEEYFRNLTPADE